MPGSRSVHHLMIGRPEQPTATPLLWLEPRPDGWALPRWESAEQRAADVTELTRAAGERLRAEVSVLTCLRDGPADPDGLRHQVHDLDVHGASGAGGWSPPGPGRWFAGAEAARVGLALTDHAPLLAQWFEARRARLRPADGRDWLLPGWRDAVLTWVADELSRRGASPVSHVEQVRIWEFSQVLRFRTETRELYLKALPKAGAAELSLTAWLAARHPAVVPDVVAVEPARGWMLMRASSGPALDQVGDVARWEQAADALARVQVESVGRLAELRALGCPDRPLAWLDAEIDPLLADRAAMQPMDPEALTDAEIERLRALGPELHALCAGLEAEGFPPALEHGDFWAANVIATDRACVILDWEDATLAHPFLSPDLLLASLDYARDVGQEPDAARRIRRAYLAPWLEAGPGRGWRGEGLERTFDLAQRLAPLHRAVQFRLGLSRIETSWEVRSFVPYFLRRLLAGG